MDPVTTPLKISALRLTNIRGFRGLTLDLGTHEAAPRRKTLVIGKNGTCKSTILRAIAIGLSDLADASRLISEPIGGIVSEGEEAGRIRVELYFDGRQAERDSHIARTQDKEFILRRKYDGGPNREGWLASATPFVCGYGAGRFGIGAEISREYRIADSVYTLFNYQQPLVGTELTLRRLEDFLGTVPYQRTLSAIKRALGLTGSDEIRLGRGGGVEVLGPSIGGRIPLEGWADGYRMTFTWILDLYAWAMKAGSIDEDGYIEGILLIDEIEQHLHPSMQAEILPRLSELLPKMQIFATTHSPLVALDAKPEELVVLKREGDRIVVEEDVPDFLGYTVEDMLADPRLFDSEVYGQETRRKLAEYRDLTAIPKEERDEDQRYRLRSLATEIRSLEGYKESENETSRLLKEFMTKYGL